MQRFIFLTTLRFCQGSVEMPWACSVWYRVDRQLGAGDLFSPMASMQDAGHLAGQQGPLFASVSAAWASSQHGGWIPRASVHRGPGRSTKHFMTLSQESQHDTSAISTFNWLKLSQRPARLNMGKNGFRLLMGSGEGQDFKSFYNTLWAGKYCCGHLWGNTVWYPC